LESGFILYQMTETIVQPKFYTNTASKSAAAQDPLHFTQAGPFHG